MACSLKTSFVGSRYNETIIKDGYHFPSSGSLQFKESYSKDFMGKSILISDPKGLHKWDPKPPTNFSVHAQTSICISRAMRWWEKTLKPNMIEINSAPQLVDSLSSAGDKLVIIDFYSPGCGGCKALHPKICQLAESNPNAIFLKVNYEELKPMCYGLNIHVLPFFRFYRGAEGKLCSFSCTNATVKKFKDALAKYGTDRCSLGPAKGLEESELLKLASIGEISINLPSPSTMESLVLKGMGVPETLGKASNKMGLKGESTVLVA